MFVRTLLYFLAALGFVFVLLAVFVLLDHSMRPYFTHLFLRSWDTTMSATSTNTLGFILWTLALSCSLWIAGILLKWNSLRATKDAVSFQNVLFQSLWPDGAVTAGVTVLLVFGALMCFLLRTVYFDHLDSGFKNVELQKENEKLKLGLEKKTHNLDTTDPAFINMTSTIRAFMLYRRAIGPEAKCMILITFPKDEQSHIEMPFITFAVFGSNCPNGSLQNIGIKPENVDEESVKGAAPGTIIFHALPGSKGADQLSDSLGNLFQVRRSYKLPAEVPENTVWIQFGPHAKWNSELIMENRIEAHNK